MIRVRWSRCIDNIKSTSEGRGTVLSLHIEVVSRWICLNQDLNDAGLAGVCSTD